MKQNNWNFLASKETLKQGCSLFKVEMLLGIKLSSNMF